MSKILDKLNKLINEDEDFSDIINGFENFSICEHLKELKKNNRMVISGCCFNPGIGDVNFESNRNVEYYGNRAIEEGSYIARSLTRDIENSINNAMFNNFITTSSYSHEENNDNTLDEEALYSAIRLLERSQRQHESNIINTNIA